jgi:stringent starvation protein B
MARLRAYLVQATYDWLVDHEFTPYLMLDAQDPEVDVPEEYIDDGRIILNVGPEAIRGLTIDPDFLAFSASFSGEPLDIYAPIEAVLALYSKETGQGVYAREDDYGMWVNEGETEEDLDPFPADETDVSITNRSRQDTLKAAKKAGLRVIK